MADIFLSYAREDEARARTVATALHARGWSVWWDRRIPPGKDFNAYIQQQLDAARCIVVLWSKASVASQFVRDEASEGLNGRLVPALIEKIKQPLGFRQLHAANLIDWNGAGGHEEFEWLVGAITDLAPPLSRATTTEPATQPDERPEIRIRRVGGRIVISYRREDSSGHVLALLPLLRRHFGAERIFKDTDNIDPGSDFLNVFQLEVRSCAVMLVVIGREFTTIQNHRTGQRLLDDPHDFVRIEIAAGLANEHIVVIPVLVDGAQMPRGDELPNDLQRLVTRQALRLSDQRWEADVNTLIQIIDKVSENSPQER